MENLNLNNVRVRIAPSPTGYVHIGTLRTVLYNYLFARRYGGTFIVRVEDTDQTRFVPGAIEDLLETLSWAGLEVDEGPVLIDEKIEQKGDFGPYVQSERLDIYTKHIKTLIDKKKAYHCFCSKERLDDLRDDQRKNKLPPKYDGLCRDLTSDEVHKRVAKKQPYVIRFRMPDNKDVVFDDAIRGTIIINSKDLDDFVLIKADGFPTYHFANVVDDHLMKITHVLRGEEWITSTPKHILLYESFGWHAPIYAHLPQLLNKNKKKMSKRQGDVMVKDFIAAGYLKDALINFIALLGWNAGTDQEVYTRDELMKQFSLENVHKAGAVFDVDKLDWINGVYIRELSIDKFMEICLPYLEDAGLVKQKDSTFINPKSKKPITAHWLKQVLALEQPRVKKLTELPEAIEYFFTPSVKLTKKMITWKKSTPAKTLKVLKDLKTFLKGLEESDFTLTKLEKEIKQFIEDLNVGNGDVLWPLRVSLSGRERSPGPFELAAAMGKTMTIKRLDGAIKKLSS
jgi:nondiscriminating glutamyl-tRNA synthetase